MKKYRVLTVITVILVIAALTSISFFGVYKKKEFKTVNIVPDYILGMDLSGYITLNLDVDTSVKDTKIYDKDGNLVESPDSDTDYSEENGYTKVDDMVNSADVLNEQSYEKSKAILIDRLNKTGVKQYNIREDKETGRISIDIPDDNNLNQVITTLAQVGKIEVQDNDTKEVLLDNKDISKASAVYGTSKDGTSTNVYLRLKMDKDGAKKLEDMSKKYLGQATTGDDGSTSTTNKIRIMYDNIYGDSTDKPFLTTYFGEANTDGNLDVYIGNGTTSQEINGYMNKAQSYAIAINTGKLPVAYTPSAMDLNSTITTKTIMNFIYGLIAVLAILNIFLIIKFKLKGIYSVILQVGYIAGLLLIVRVTNVPIAIEGIFGIIIAALINYVFMYMVLRNILKQDINKIKTIRNTIFKLTMMLIPIYVIAVIFSFITIVNISSLGMTLMWGIVLFYIYNFIFTNLLLGSREMEA